MDEKELGVILEEYYDRAKRNQTILQVDLFGIKFGPIIQENGLSIKKIVQLSGIGGSYITEVTKAVKLSEYVVIKKKEEKKNEKNEK